MLEDELHEVRERFFVGAFTPALERAQSTQAKNDLTEAERKGIEARWYDRYDVLFNKVDIDWRHHQMSEDFHFMQSR